MHHIPCLYNVLCVELVLQVVKNSFWLLSYLKISLVMGTYFSKSMRKRLGVFVCSFSIPLNSFSSFFKKFWWSAAALSSFTLAKIYMDCAVPLLVFSLLESVTIWRIIFIVLSWETIEHKIFWNLGNKILPTATLEIEVTFRNKNGVGNFILYAYRYISACMYICVYTSTQLFKSYRHEHHTCRHRAANL